MHNHPPSVVNRIPRLRPEEASIQTLVMLLVPFLLIASACISRPPAGPRPPRPTVMKVTAREYGFEYAQAGKVVSQGRVALEMENKGRLHHQLTMIIVPEDMPGTIKEEARSSDTHRVFENVFALPARPPGGRGSFAVDLEPGRYAMVCLVEDRGGTLHAQKGMASEFRVA